MELADILDGAIELLKRNFGPVALIVLAFVAPVQVLSAYASRHFLRQASSMWVDIFSGRQPAQPDPNVFGSSTFVTLIAAIVIAVIVVPLVAGAISHLVAESYLGREASAGTAIRAAGRLWWSLLIASVLIHLLEGIAVFGLVVGAVFVMGFFVVTAPAIVVERLGPGKGMRRSANLMRPRYWPNLGIAVLAGIIAYFLGGILAFFGQVFAFLPSGINWVFVAVFGVLSQLVQISIIAIAATLLYFDARIRIEGFDLEMMARELERGTAG